MATERSILSANALPNLADRLPPHAFFLVSALFHYLGPSFAVLLFAQIPPVGVAWLRIASAALVFGCWRRPWRFFDRMGHRERRVVIALGVTLAAMNILFYEAIARLPLAVVGAIEFLGPIGVAAWGVRTRRNVVALILAAIGVYALADVRIAGQPLSYVFAFANCALFVAYIILGHRISAEGGELSGVDRLGCAMLVASIAALPFGLADAMPAFASPLLLGAAIGVGISSSVIPYVCDQLAMARLPRPTFALLLSLLPASAAVIGFVVLGQKPTALDLTGIALIIAGVALHRSYRT